MTKSIQLAKIARRFEDCTHREPAIFAPFVPSSKRGVLASCNLRGNEREIYVLLPGRRNEFVGCSAEPKWNW
jgi:hypothetical protein